MTTTQGDDILAIDDTPVLAVPVPEWNTTVYVRTITAAETNRINYVDANERLRDNYLGEFAALILCDEQGRRLFADEDAPALGAKSRQALRRISEAAQKHNGILDEDDEEQAGKNSEPTTDDASPS